MYTQKEMDKNGIGNMNRKIMQKEMKHKKGEKEREQQIKS